MSFFSRLFRRSKKINKATIKNVINTGNSSLSVIYQGIINAKVLNIRSEPSMNGGKLGRYTKGTVISILEKTSNDWYRFKYNDKDAYVSGKYVTLMKGKITASALNVRAKASLNDEVLGKLKRNDIVTIAQIQNKWYKIHFKGGFGYVYAKFVDIVNSSTSTTNTSGTTSSDSNKKHLKDDSNLIKATLEASNQIAVPSSPRTQRIVAKTHNKFGGLITQISKQLNIDTATAISIISVESGGNAYGKNGKVLIRFEVHLFWRFWGKNNEKKFKEHFKFNPRKGWTNHMFRKSKRDSWVSFHGNQDKEWEAFEFACKLNSTAAHLSTSYGAPQILGTNFKRIGYSSPENLLKYFQKDVRYQILAFFDFLTPKMITAVQSKDFTTFARYYNGSGQAHRYGSYIKSFYNAYKGL